MDDSIARDLKPAAVRRRIEESLEADLDDTGLRDELERLAETWAFGGFTWIWGPRLYRRNRVLFRPFILNHFSNWEVTRFREWGPEQEFVNWDGRVADQLGPWLEEVDERDDVELFRKLYLWKIGGRWGKSAEKLWKRDLLERFRAAENRGQRDTVLAKFDLGLTLDEAAACELYGIDPDASREFVRNNIRRSYYYGEDRKLWERLRAQAFERGDQELAWEIYRRQVPQKQWEQDVLRAAERIDDADRLLEELERRHPEGWDLKLGMTFLRLVERRGRDVLPYVRKHLKSVFRSWWGDRDGYQQLVDFATRHQWWDLWSALVRSCSRGDEYNREVAKLLLDRRMDDDATVKRLLMLTGVSREWNFGPFSFAEVQQLDDETAQLFYGRYPDLLRGPFKMHISAGWYNTYDGLTRAAIAAGDETLIDYLASRSVTREQYGSGYGGAQVAVAETLSRYYEALKDDAAEFTQRASAVLSQVPAYTVTNYNRLIRTNRLARLLYQRSASAFLADPAAIRDLLEAPEIHAQALALRALGLDRDDARQLAAANLDLLQATFLRPLHRKTRALAFRALANAAIDSRRAAEIYHRARQALDLPDKRYPKESLIGLLGRLLHQWPELRTQREQPVVYGEAVASSQ